VTLARPKGDIKELKGDIKELKGDIKELKGDISWRISGQAGVAWAGLPDALSL